MARREFVFQIAVNDDAEWREHLKTPGLVVADVFSSWCGPCKIAVALFKKAYLDFSGSNRAVKFLLVDTDKVEALRDYGGTAMPVFLFFKNGQLVETVKGVDPPRLVELMEKHAPPPSA